MMDSLSFNQNICFTIFSKVPTEVMVSQIMIDPEQDFSRNRNRKGYYFFISETDTESEPENFLDRKRNRFRKASNRRNGFGNRIEIGIQKYLKKMDGRAENRNFIVTLHLL